MSSIHGIGIQARSYSRPMLHREASYGGAQRRLLYTFHANIQAAETPPQDTPPFHANYANPVDATAVAWRTPLFLIQDEFHTRPGGIQ